MVCRFPPRTFRSAHSSASDSRLGNRTCRSFSALSSRGCCLTLRSTFGGTRLLAVRARIGSRCGVLDETAAADFYNNRCARVACLEPVLAGLTRSLRADYPRKRRTAFPDTFARDRVDEPTRKPEPHAVTLAGKLTHDRP